MLTAPPGATPSYGTASFQRGEIGGAAITGLHRRQRGRKHIRRVQARDIQPGAPTVLLVTSNGPAHVDINGGPSGTNHPDLIDRTAVIESNLLPEGYIRPAIKVPEGLASFGRHNTGAARECQQRNRNATNIHDSPLECVKGERAAPLTVTVKAWLAPKRNEVKR